MTIILKLKPKVICLTPIRNEAWILERFLKAASLWADVIIIADQMSDDNSREIVKHYPKVILIDNIDRNYDEQARQKLLIEEARKIEGQRLLIALDADEIFSPEIFTSPEWQTILEARPGTIFKFQWANFAPDLRNMWLGYHFPWGYMDDNQDHVSTKKIHSGRIPLPDSNNIITLHQIKVIHFQYTDWARMLSKHYLYQCIEIINYPQKSPLEIYIQYHHMHIIPEREKIEIPATWISEYNKLGIDITSVFIENKKWFDLQILNLIEEYGSRKFRKLNIWSVDWRNKASKLCKNNPDNFIDPRNFLERQVQKWLFGNYRIYKIYEFKKIVNFIKILFNY